MCSWCNDIEGFDHYGAGATRPRVREAKQNGCCSYYLRSCRDYYIESSIRFQRDTHRRVPKRDPDDPYYCLELGEGLLPFMFDRVGDMKDWYYLVYRPTRRRKLYRHNTAGEGAGSPEERVPRGVEDETNGWPKLHDF